MFINYTFPGSPADNQFKGPGVIATITSSVVLVVVLCGYLVVCVVTKLAGMLYWFLFHVYVHVSYILLHKCRMFLVPSSENSHMPSTDVALDSIQHPNPSFNTEVYMIICMLAFLILTILFMKENCRQRLGHTEEEKEEYVPSLAYDYVRHQ